MLKKTLLVLSGIGISLIMAEFSLRLAGYFYYTFHIRQEADKIGYSIVNDRAKVLPQDSSLIRVLCVGDSWTFGMGAESGYSYPAQLQAISDQESPRRYRIYNAGVPGCTSGKLLSYLPAFLKKYNPKIAIILIGMNDVSNYSVSEILYASNWMRKFYFTLANAVSDLRVYKLTRLGLDGLREKFRAFRKQTANVNADRKAKSAQWCESGHNLYIAGNFELGETYLKKAIDMDPGNELAYIYLGDLYQLAQQRDKSLFFFQKLLEINPYTSLRPEVYRFLFFMYQDRSYARGTRDKIVYLIKKIPSDSEFRNPGAPFILDSEATMKNLESNLTRITELLRTNGVTLVLLTYIDRGSPSSLCGLTRDFSQKYGVILVDNAKDFACLPDRDGYFGRDNHPNNKGYRFIAANIYKTLKINENHQYAKSN